MRIAIVHYHLRPGGVTKVIQHALTALALSANANESSEPVRAVVLAGEPPADAMPIAPYTVVEALGYSATAPADIARLAAQLESAAQQALGGAPDVWHVHNHALGKNLALPALVRHFAQQGRRLLLQIHDFAEDGRPANYKFLSDHLGGKAPAKLGAYLYPQGPHVHYALINQRDLGFLQAAGVPAERLHSLPNAVSVEAGGDIERPEPGDGDRLLVYPTRAIRRKNLGEFLLWAALAGPGERFAVTRAPQNPAAQAMYADWVAFAQALNVPVEFDYGAQWAGNFAGLLCAADALVTTSVAEGFGLAFLEPWLLRRPLLGRKLPEITNEFERAGFDFGGLYDRLNVPTAWVGRDTFEQKVRTALRAVYVSYGRTMPPDAVERAVAAAMTGELIDFGRLDESLQQDVIRQLQASPTLRRDVVPSTLRPDGEQPARIARNRELVRTRYNLDAYGARLRQIYRAAAESASAAPDALEAGALLDRFIAPERFCLLRT